MLITQIKNFRWNGEFNVIVIGFGGAGATAARFAADNASKVLLLDAAPSGHEGGNTRYCGQLIGGTKDANLYKKYYEHLTAPFKLDKKIIEVFTTGVANMEEYLKKYLDVQPFSFLDNPSATTVKSVKSDFPDYPEYYGAEAYNIFTVHNGKHIEDGALWTKIREKVLERLDKITIWYNSPAKHLIQDKNGNIIGVQIDHNGITLNIHAENGVVLASGGFENDSERIRNNLGIPNIVPIGSLYNRGDSIKLSEEVGADQWHNTVYNAGGMYHGLTYAASKENRGKLTFTWPAMYTGSIFVVGNDGSRYFKEDEHSRAGYLFLHGYGRHPYQSLNSWVVFDNSQLSKFKRIDDSELKNALKTMTIANSPTELAKKLNFLPNVFEVTLKNFNEQAKIGKDYEYHRDPKTLSQFTGNKLYAFKLEPAILNTQGGPRRNEKAQIVRPDNSVIGHLFGAGEAGSITANQYQAGQDVAELLIFGKIAGQNAAKVPKSKTEYTVTTDDDLSSDEYIESFAVSKNQYIGKSNSGMGNELVVRVTVDSLASKICNVEILKQSETEDIGQKALELLPNEVVKRNSINVDAITGASTTVSAFKEAVADALNKIK